MNAKAKGRELSYQPRYIYTLMLLPQVEPNVVAHIICLSEARGAFENAAPGATLLDKLDAKAVAAMAQVVAPLVTAEDDPLLAAARMQVRWHLLFCGMWHDALRFAQCSAAQALAGNDDSLVQKVPQDRHTKSPEGNSANCSSSSSDSSHCSHRSC